MLQIRGDDAVAFSKKAAYCRVQRLGHVGGKNHMVGAGAAEKSRQLLPRAIHGARAARLSLCVPRELLPFVRSAWIPARSTPSGLRIVVVALSR